MWRPPLAPGDATLFDYRTLHYGGANPSARERPMLYLTFSRSWYSDPVNHAEDVVPRDGEFRALDDADETDDDGVDDATNESDAAEYDDEHELSFGGGAFHVTLRARSSWRGGALCDASHGGARDASGVLLWPGARAAAAAIADAAAAASNDKCGGGGAAKSQLVLAARACSSWDPARASPA